MAGFGRNGWPVSIGIGGRHGSEYAGGTDEDRGGALVAALDAAEKGSIVHVGAGAYVATDLLRDGVRLFCEQGVRVDQTPSTGSTKLFWDHGQSISFTIDGFGQFRNTNDGSGDQEVFSIDASSVGSIKCDELYSENGTCFALNGNCDVTAYANRIVSRDGTFDNFSHEGILTIYADYVKSTGNYCVEVDGGSIIVDTWKQAKGLMESPQATTIELVTNDDNGRCQVSNFHMISGDGEVTANVYGYPVNKLYLNNCDLECSESSPVYVGSNATVYTTGCSNVNGNDAELVSGSGQWIDE